MHSFSALGWQNLQKKHDRWAGSHKSECQCIMKYVMHLFQNPYMLHSNLHYSTACVVLQRPIQYTPQLRDDKISIQNMIIGMEVTLLDANITSTLVYLLVECIFFDCLLQANLHYSTVCVVLREPKNCKEKTRNCSYFQK